MNKHTLFTMIMDTIVTSAPRHLVENVTAQTSAVSPGACTDASQYFRDAIICDLLRKCPNPVVKVDLEKVTIQKWQEAETLCCYTNARLAPYRSEFDNLIDVERSALFEHVVHAVRNEVGRLLGKCPEALDPVLTGGSTLSDRYGHTSAPDKISTRHTLYWNSNTLKLLMHYYATPWFRNISGEVVESRGNAYFTVPKSSKILRACAKEASLMMPLQRAAGIVMSKRLSQLGNDIPSGEARHRALAKHASLFDDYATVDCSMASDTISYELVKVLLPTDWFTLLDTIRAPVTTVDGKNIYLNKFSSMGNGYTFELETVIFLAIANVACDLTQTRRDCSQYGDDTIIPTKGVRMYTNMLTFFGFIVNVDKTFTSGHFRESCGGDYYRGQFVTTPKIKDLDDCDDCYITCLVRLLNIINPFRGVFVIDRLHALLLRQLPLEVRRCGGPVHFGNSVIHGLPESRTTVKSKRKNGVEGPSPYQGIKVIQYHKGKLLQYTRWGEKTFLATCFMTTFPVCVEPCVKFSHIGVAPRYGSNYLPTAVSNRYKFKC